MDVLLITSMLDALSNAYADDIIILSCTIHGLQHMLNT